MNKNITGILPKCNYAEQNLTANKYLLYYIRLQNGGLLEVFVEPTPGTEEFKSVLEHTKAYRENIGPVDGQYKKGRGRKEGEYAGIWRSDPLVYGKYESITYRKPVKVKVTHHATFETETVLAEGESSNDVELDCFSDLPNGTTLIKHDIAIVTTT